MQYQDTAELRICQACLIRHANGDCIDCIAELTDRDDVECTHGVPRECWTGWELALGGDDDGDSDDACDWCGDEQAGDRYTASAFMMTAEHWVQRGTALVEVVRLARVRPSAYTSDQHPAVLLDRAAEYVRLAVNARRYATEYLSGTSR